MTYTEEDRTKGLAIYQEHGLATAHRETGVPRATLHRWARAAGFDPADIVERSVTKTRAAGERSPFAWWRWPIRAGLGSTGDRPGCAGEPMGKPRPRRVRPKELPLRRATELAHPSGPARTTTDPGPGDGAQLLPASIPWDRPHEGERPHARDMPLDGHRHPPRHPLASKTHRRRQRPGQSIAKNTAQSRDAMPIGARAEAAAGSHGEGADCDRANGLGSSRCPLGSGRPQPELPTVLYARRTFSVY